MGVKSLVHQNQHVLGQVSVSSYIKKDHYAWVGGTHAPTCSTPTEGVQGLLITHAGGGGRGSPIYTESSGADGGTGGRGHGIRNTRLRPGILAHHSKSSPGLLGQVPRFPCLEPQHAKLCRLQEQSDSGAWYSMPVLTSLLLIQCWAQ